MKKVNLKIKGGKIEADFSGFVGKSCEQLEDRIRPENLEVDEKTLKPEYNFSSDQTQNETEQNTW